MDVAALILALAALAACVLRRGDLAFGLLVALLICQFVHLTGHVVTVN